MTLSPNIATYIKISVAF